MEPSTCSETPASHGSGCTRRSCQRRRRSSSSARNPSKSACAPITAAWPRRRRVNTSVLTQAGRQDCNPPTGNGTYCEYTFLSPTRSIVWLSVSSFSVGPATAAARGDAPAVSGSVAHSGWRAAWLRAWSRTGQHSSARPPAAMRAARTAARAAAPPASYTTSLATTTCPPPPPPPPPGIVQRQTEKRRKTKRYETKRQRTHKGRKATKKIGKRGISKGKARS